MTCYKLLLTLIVFLWKLNVIRALGGSSVPDCTEKDFWGNCYKDALCVCNGGKWYETTITTIKELDSAMQSAEVQSFGSICNCSNSKPVEQCTNPALFDNAASCEELVAVVDTTTQQTTTTEQTTTTPQTTTTTTEQTTTTPQTTTIKQTTTTPQTTTTEQTTTTPQTTTTQQQSTATTSTFEVSVEQTTIPSAMCPCACDYYDKIEYWSNETNQLAQYNELRQKLTHLQNLLKVDIKNLSSSINKRVSANDDRPSAMFTGYIGAVLLFIFFGGIILADLSLLIRHIRSFCRYMKKLCAKK